MKSTSWDYPRLGRHLLSQDHIPRVSLSRTLSSAQNNLSLSSSSSISRPDPDTIMTTRTTRASPCLICASRPGHNKVLSFSTSSSSPSVHLLTCLFLGSSTDVEDYCHFVFCPMCLSVVRRLIRLSDQVEDIKGRIKAVLKYSRRGVTTGPHKDYDDDDHDDFEIPPCKEEGNKDYHFDEEENVGFEFPGVEEAVPFSGQVKEEEDMDSILPLDWCPENLPPPDVLHDDDDDCIGPSSSDDSTAPLPHHSKRKTRFECSICQKVYKTKVTLKVHMSKIHQVEMEKKRLPNSSLDYVCHVCGKSFGQGRYLKKHLKEKHPEKEEGNPSEKSVCPICKKVFESRSIHVFKAHSHPDPEDQTKVVYRCPQCPKSFDKANLFRFHFRRIHRKDENVHKCGDCGKVFQHPVLLRNHFNSSHISQEEQRKCPVCGQSFSSVVERIDHERVVHKGLPSTQCYFCSRFFSKASSYQNHLRLHTLERPFPCSKCGKEFNLEGSWKTHQARVCERNKDGPIQRPKDGPRSCPHCGKTLASELTLQTHMRSIHQAQKMEISLPISSTYACPIPTCGKNYEKMWILTKHLKRVHLINPFSAEAEAMVCPICKINFRNKTIFEAHTHPDPESVLFTCQACHQTFDNDSSFRSHLRRVHYKKELEACTCEKCGKVFRSKSGFSAHRNSCSMSAKERRTCPVSTCGKVFRTPAEMVDHQRVFHKGLSSSSQKCYFCGRAFLNPTHLGRHVRLHTLERPYPCSKCGKEFIEETGLKQHKGTSSSCGTDQEREEWTRRHGSKLSCTICKRCFLIEAVLAAHTHPDPNDPSKVLYVCAECPRTFSTNTKFRGHLRDAHSKKGIAPCPYCGKVLRVVRLTRHFKVCSKAPGGSRQ